MQLFLTQPEEISVSDFVRVKFDGKSFRTYFKNVLTDLQTAKSGDVFYVKSYGQKKKPLVTKAELPCSRGNKIAWTLSFIGEHKWVNSYDEFIESVSTLSDLEENDTFFYKVDENRSYGIAFRKGRKNLLTPILAYVSNTISEENLQKLLDDYVEFRPIFCPRTFFDFL